MLVLFILLAFLESCGYMARIAFVLDRIFRKFGLSGKSFIPMLVGTGCGVPGIMASRTIENERDRRMTIMTTTFIPCGAKQPFIAMIAGAIFGGSPWIATSAYFIGMAAIVVSGIMLKKTKMFSGDPAPFVMELPAYHLPTVGNLLRSMWERGWSFIKKAGTIILLSTILVWFTTYFGFVDGTFRMLGAVWKCVDVGFGHNRPVDAVIRPEDIDLVKPGEGVIDGIVTNLIFKGVHYEMEVLANNYELLVHSTDMFPVGTEVGIKVDPFDIQIMKKPESEDEEAPAVEE